MRVHTIDREQRLPVAPEQAFGFFAEARNLERITPPWLRFRVLDSPPMGRGTLLRYRLRVRGVPIRWLTRIEEWRPGERFTDIQLRGPYRYWRHIHSFRRDGDGTMVVDQIRYSMRAGRFGEIVNERLVAADLERIFDYRTEAIEAIFATPE